MFYRLSAIAVASLAVLTAANPIEVRSGTSECNTGGMYCCQSTQSVSWLDLRKVYIPRTDTNGGMNVGCSPTTIIT
ncbi:hypothetical protein ID866_12405 [Astraeus odoratus]|nr:hypothetical protein ID866_12405 [Astraeus odoratus]